MSIVFGVTDPTAPPRENRGIDVHVNVWNSRVRNDRLLACVALWLSPQQETGGHELIGHVPSSFLQRFALALAFSAFVCGTAGAQTLSIAETEDLVRTRYFEGMPEEAAARIGPEGAQRLIEMLLDSEEAASHGQILFALGLCGSPDARAAILDWATRLESRGSVEIDRDAFKAWQALPHALGSLAKFDPRAVADLEVWMKSDAPGWRFRHFKAARLHDLARRSAATSLAQTGLPEARRALDRAGRDTSDLRLDAYLRAARAQHAERVREMTR